MLEKLHVHGFRTLVETEVHFDPLTIMIGKNGAGKTSILDVLQLLGNFARGGVDRAFGPPPWSLGWQRTKGIGDIPMLRFDVTVRVPSGAEYRYALSLDEREGEAHVQEERLIRLSDHQTIASFSRPNPPPTGSILSPGSGESAGEIEGVATILKSVVSYELNPAAIEQGTDPEHGYITRDGFGVAGFLAHLKDQQPKVFASLEARLKRLRPETELIDIWSTGKTYWGLRDHGQQRAFAACHLSWGERQLVGLLCVLYGAKPQSTIAIEEIDRGFHPSRYEAVIEMLSQATYDGLDGRPPIQAVITTHSPSFINRLGDRLGEIRMVERVPGCGTMVRSLQGLVTERLGAQGPVAPVGEVWEMGLLDDLVAQELS